MAGAVPVVPGLNHNVKYRGRAYHVQTEDLGAANPHVVTHLFEGGNVVAARKTSYAGQGQAHDLVTLVRGLMERQHKEMLRDLVNGVYDARLEVAAQAKAWQPGELAAGPAPAPERRAPVIPAPLPPPPQAASLETPGEEPDDSIDRAILAYLAGEGEEGPR